MTKAFLTMVEELARFKRRHGHCDVPAVYELNPKLGRWVAAQRHRRKSGRMPSSCIRTLDGMGFIWSANGHRWEAMARALEEFRARHGHCRVPKLWEEDQPLADWTHNQRHKGKNGRLSPERFRRLDALGFVWAIRNSSPIRTRRRQEVAARPTVARFAPAAVKSRLSVVSRVPAAEGGASRAGRAGDRSAMPPCPIEFQWRSGDMDFRVLWNARDPLPEEVARYVRVNGVLPPCSGVREPSPCSRAS